MQLTFEQIDNEGKRIEVTNLVKDQGRIIELNGVMVKVILRKDYFSKAEKFYVGENYCPHIEVRSVKDKEPNILTETGYRSCFFNFWVLEDYKTFEGVVVCVLNEVLNENNKNKSKEKLSIKWNLENDISKI